MTAHRLVGACDQANHSTRRRNDHQIAAIDTRSRSSSRALELGGYRTAVAVPMLKDDELIGAIVHLPRGGAPVHRQADRAGAELCRAGRDRHRERAAAQRAAPAPGGSPEFWSSRPRPPDVLQGHLQLARRSAAGVPRPCWRMRRACARRSFGTIWLRRRRHVRACRQRDNAASV